METLSNQQDQLGLGFLGALNVDRNTSASCKDDALLNSASENQLELASLDNVCFEDENSDIFKDEISQIWAKVLSVLSKKLENQVFELWFSNLKLNSIKDEKALVLAENSFAAIWLSENYKDLIRNSISLILGRTISVDISSEEDLSLDNSSDKSNANVSLKKDSSSNQNDINSRFNLSSNLTVSSRNTSPIKFSINPKNTFDNFIVGQGNQVAHAVSMAVASAPGVSYNPLFLYGPTGLGKTHLMHAIAHYVMKNRPDAKVVYASSETFMNQYVKSLMEKNEAGFRKMYRQVDLLLIDDIQFLGGKEKTQEEFFHTFNALHDEGKQIVISSDRMASEIVKLQDRLVSRFQWGMSADIQAPDFETRLAIIIKKARDMSLNLSSEVVNFMAEKISCNVRRIEGALTRIAAYNANMNFPVIHLDLVQRLLSDIILEEQVQKAVSIDQIQDKVCSYFNLSVEDMKSKKRPNKIALPRQVAMYLCRMQTSHTLKEIGQAFGGRGHDTVLHAIKTIEDMCEQDVNIASSVELLKKQFNK